METENELPKFKLQIFGQAFVYQKMQIPRKEQQVTESGIVCDVLNWYNELECPQMAVNHNDLYIKRSHAEQAVKELGAAIIRTLEAKNLIVER